MDQTPVLEHLALLAIGLVSVTIPTYAIAVTVLVKELENAAPKIRERRERLLKYLSSPELRKSLSNVETGQQPVDNLRLTIESFQKEEGGLKRGGFFLRKEGAVFLPVVFYLLCFGFSVGGMMFALPDWYLVLPLLSLAFGLVSLALTLIAIERAAFRVEMKIPDVIYTKGLPPEVTSQNHD